VGNAKAIRLQPISSALARETIGRLHYSGKVVNNSQFHVGVFFLGKLEGAIQLGPPMMRTQALPLVAGTPWNGVLEINRMAFSENLPRNSESRALGILFRMLRNKRPDIGWLLSYSDATQCGDGTIYRAAGFLLTQIAKSESLFRMPDGQVFMRMSLRPGTDARRRVFAAYKIVDVGQHPAAPLIRAGATRLVGHQLRYIYFLNPKLRANLTCKVLPYSAIERAGAGMYKGKLRATSIGADAPTFQVGEGGSQPTVALQSQAEAEASNRIAIDA
jgi:hypothetical protein